MREILADLVAEQQGLDQSLQRAPDRDWKKAVGDRGWSVQDTIAYLWWAERHAARLLEGEIVASSTVETHGDVEGFEQAGVDAAAGKRPQEVIEQWRFARADVVDALSRLSKADRVDWLDGDISARTFATTRLADTWAHGLEILTALDKEIIDTPRLIHVAWLGWATLPNAFEKAGEEYPEAVRVELVGPGYARWVYGPEDSEHIVRGQATDWCRLVVGFFDAGEAESLSAEGSLAEAALDLADIRP
jgi:uncharacterized protein (TIGR03084 family)